MTTGARPARRPATADGQIDAEQAAEVGAAGMQLYLRFLGQPSATVGGRPARLRPRWTELLAVLALHGEGLGCDELADLVYGERGNPATLKPEVARMRRAFPLASRPYRIAAPFGADFLDVPKLVEAGALLEAVKLFRGPLLAFSSAPRVVEERLVIEEILRRAALRSSAATEVLALASRFRDDYELWTAALDLLPPTDPRRSTAEVHAARLGRELRGVPWRRGSGAPR